MSEASSEDVVIAVASLDQFFNAPSIDPLSARETELLGKSGLEILTQRLQARGAAYTRLLIHVPPEQNTPELLQQITLAIPRYCRAKIDDNLSAIREMRRRHALGLGILSGAVLLLIAVAYALYVTALSSAPTPLLYAIAFVISLFTWVTLWDALEALLFDPIPLRRENATLRKVIDLKLAIAPEASTVEPAEAPSSS